MDAIDIIGKGLLIAFLIYAVPYFVGFWFTRGVMAARRQGPPEAPRPGNNPPPTYDRPPPPPNPPRVGGIQ